MPASLARTDSARLGCTLFHGVESGPELSGLAGALGRRGRRALKKSDPGGGAGRSKNVGGADFSQNCALRGIEP
jgi:hypothetical protein